MAIAVEQYHSVRAMIKGLCSNYDGPTGGCLLLDNGTVVRCPQISSPRLVCRFFHDVLLEDRSSKALKAEIMGDDHVRQCVICGRLFRAVSVQADRCARCAGEKVGAYRPMPPAEHTESARKRFSLAENARECFSEGKETHR